MLLFYIRKTKKSSLKLKAIWEQVFPEDTELRIQRAFEILLSDEFSQPSNNSLLTTIDKGLEEPYAKSNERQTAHPSRNSRPTANISKIGPKISKGQKTQRH